MAISADTSIEFFGTQDDLGNTSSAVTNNSFSAAADLVEWTNDDDVMVGAMILEATWSVAPTANTSVTLFAQLMNIQSTNDMEVPTANFQHVVLGDFPVKNITTIQRVPIDIALPNTATSQVYQFFIRNNSGQTISAGWKLLITPKAVGPHA